MVLTIEDLVEQLGRYKKQLTDAENAVQQLRGAIAACENHMKLMVEKQNKKVQDEQQQKDIQNAAQEGNESKDHSSQHQDGDCGGQVPETSGSDSLCESRQEQPQEGEIA